MFLEAFFYVSRYKLQKFKILPPNPEFRGDSSSSNRPNKPAVNRFASRPHTPTNSSEPRAVETSAKT
jgi:hypothetical protein